LRAACPGAPSGGSILREDQVLDRFPDRRVEFELLADLRDALVGLAQDAHVVLVDLLAESLERGVLFVFFEQLADLVDLLLGEDGARVRRGDY
jgi:hypothetical protein